MISESNFFVFFFKNEMFISLQNCVRKREKKESEKVKGGIQPMTPFLSHHFTVKPSISLPRVLKPVYFQRL